MGFPALRYLRGGHVRSTLVFNLLPSVPEFQWAGEYIAGLPKYQTKQLEIDSCHAGLFEAYTQMQSELFNAFRRRPEPLWVRS